MTTGPADPYENLREAAAAKSAAAKAAAQRAIMALEARGEAVNFKSVAAAAGVSTGYLYSNADLRREIAERRRQPPPPVAASRAARESGEAGLATKYAAVVREVKRLRAENTQLRAENERLRGDLTARRRG